MPEPSTESGAQRGIEDGTGPYAGFGGRAGRTVAGSESWWPPRAEPGRDAPNVIVMIADDLGFSDLGCYGSEIETPNLDRLARNGLRFNNYHSTPMCSPTRASLLTGLNPHAAGVGHVAHSDPGFPGYAMELADNVATLPEIFRDNGYATLMVGKWHLTKDSDCSDAGPRHSWPCQRGFDRFYGFLDGFTNLHQPHRLVEDNHGVEVDDYADGYYFTDDITDRAVSMIRSVKASDPAKPFFLYFSHGAVHAPLHAKQADIDKYRDRYHVGWDEIRAQRFERMRAMGVIPPEAVLAGRNTEPGHDVTPWHEHTEAEREVLARYMAVYAAMVDNIDQNFGRLRDALAEMGELDNTIIVFTSDNGASREGEAEGTTGYYVHLMGETDIADDLERLDLIGGPRTIPHYPRGWAMACNTPFRLYKINTHAGGHQVPMLVSWPRGLGEVDGLGGFRSQYQFVTDVQPTVLDLCGIEQPTERNGQQLKPVTGKSFVPSLEDPAARSAHTEQHYEMLGNRGFYRDGWEVVTLHLAMTEFGDHEWELYDLASDPTETVDLAAEEPGRVAELAAAWDEAAWGNQVFPLDEGSGVKYLVRPPRVSVYDEAVTLLPGTPTLERWRSQRLTMGRPLTVTARVDHGPDDQGVLVAHGDQGGGYMIWVEGREVHFTHNDGRGRMRALSSDGLGPGEHEITLRFSEPVDNRWSISLSVDGQVVAEGDGFSYLFPMAPFEGIDVGIDRRSPVSWDLYERHGPFPYTGRLRSVSFEPGEPSRSVETLIEMLRELGAAYE